MPGRRSASYRHGYQEGVEASENVCDRQMRLCAQSTDKGVHPALTVCDGELQSANLRGDSVPEGARSPRPLWETCEQQTGVDLHLDPRAAPMGWKRRLVSLELSTMMARGAQTNRAGEADIADKVARQHKEAAERLCSLVLRHYLLAARDIFDIAVEVSRD